MISSEEVLEMMPIYRKLENIPFQIFDEVRIEADDFVNLIRSNSQSFKLIMHSCIFFGFVP